MAKRVARADVRLTVEGAVSKDQVKHFILNALAQHWSVGFPRPSKIAVDVQTTDLATLRRRNRLMATNATKRNIF